MASTVWLGFYYFGKPEIDDEEQKQFDKQNQFIVHNVEKRNWLQQNYYA